MDKIYCADCRDFLPMLTNKKIDLAVIDPPYNLGIDEWDKFESEDDYFSFMINWIECLLPKLKDTSSLYIFNTPENSVFICDYLKWRGLEFQNWICWDKRDGMNSTKKRYGKGQEIILFFTTSKTYTFNYDDIRVPYDSTERIEHAKKKGILKNGKRWYPNEKGKLCGEVWHFPSERHQNKVNGKLVKPMHNTQKPKAMIERIIKASSNEGDIVLDCFMGSGTTAIVSKKLGRDFIGCEKNPEYIEMIKHNLINN